MFCWKKAEKLVDIYYETSSSEDLTEILLYFQSYLKKCANNALSKSNNSGIWINFEDFYSNFYYRLWESIEDFRIIDTSTLKNVIIRRIQYAEIETIRLYKKSYKNNNMTETSYVATQWIDLSQFEICDKNRIDDDNSLFLKQSLQELKKISIEQHDIVLLLLLGYSGKEISLMLFSENNYCNSSRKKIQRAKDKFKKLLWDKR
ncbi:hypothetical protein IGI37_001006 [Enterococcus sp. AZ194]|uniref:hypothetical protein n=1 Tax=Enterococcus sp. AZ194 TaxID=2774629 RepID=UPI003F21D273